MMTSPLHITYSVEETLSVDEFRDLLIDAGLGDRRPISDHARLQTMLSKSNGILTARLDEPGQPLVGALRALTDRAWCCYVSELAVASRVKGRGIGQRLLSELHRELGLNVSIILNSHPETAGFYKGTTIPDKLVVRCSRGCGGMADATGILRAV